MADATAAKHPCSMCGQPTTSKYAMCQRPGACSREYRRLWNRDQDKAHRNEVVRRYRQGRKSEPYVYAILFPLPGVLKVGATTGASPAVTMGTARVGARKRGWDTIDSACIWRALGDVRTEAWMQATLAFRWPGAFGKRQNRICEWFNVAGLAADALVGRLEEVYRQVPTDMLTTQRKG
jgi:hypothetical protein